MGIVWIDTFQVNHMVDLEADLASSEISVDLNEMWKLGETCFLWAWIEDRNGKEADAIFPIPLEQNMSFCMRVSHPILWNAENSYCYKLVLEIRTEDGEVLENREQYIAYFKWEVLEGTNCLNGEKVTFRSRKLPESLTGMDEITGFLKVLKREFCNTVLVESEQYSEELAQKCIEYGIYLIAPGIHLECGKITAFLEQHPQGDIFSQNPDFMIHVVQNGVLIENHSSFVNTSEYQLVFSVKHGDEYVQKGSIHADIPAGQSRYLNLPYMELHDAGEFLYRVSLCLEKGVLWEKEGYEIASGENRFSNLFL